MWPTVDILAAGDADWIQTVVVLLIFGMSGLTKITKTLLKKYGKGQEEKADTPSPGMREKPPAARPLGRPPTARPLPPRRTGAGSSEHPLGEVLEALGWPGAPHQDDAPEVSAPPELPVQRARPAQPRPTSLVIEPLPSRRPAPPLTPRPMEALQSQPLERKRSRPRRTKKAQARRVKETPPHKSTNLNVAISKIEGAEKAAHAYDIKVADDPYAELRTPSRAQLRRAILMNEILSPPLALRPPEN